VSTPSSSDSADPEYCITLFPGHNTGERYRVQAVYETRYGMDRAEKQVSARNPYGVVAPTEDEGIVA